ncbi:MAG: PrpF domain-containing protein [Candidatus Limnocylindrales bacterium]
MSDVRRLAVSILRGGTSRGVFFRAEHLPHDRELIESILRDVFGSPDARQINGLGGATVNTSKAAIIGPPTRDDADVDYTFAQVGVKSPIVDWGGNCGNISSAVGPFAIDAGLVPAVEGETIVRIHNTNTAKIIIAHVPVNGGRAVRHGDYAIPGVPGTGARVDLEFTDPGGSVTGKLLPTGRAQEEMELADGRRVRVSLVDAANPCVFVLASDIGARGTESPTEIEANVALCDTLEEIRGIAGEWMGIVPSRDVALSTSPGLPKVAMVAPAADFTSTSGEPVAATDIDLVVRSMSMQTAHRALQVTGAVCVGAAAGVEGTLVHEVTRPSDQRPEPDRVRIGIPYGVMDVVVSSHAAGNGVVVDGVRLGRTARHIMDGSVWVSADLIADEEAPRGDSEMEVLAALS